MKVIICGIVRNCGFNLKRIIPQIVKLMKSFKYSDVVIFENDSKDNTKNILQTWKKSNKNVTYFSEDNYTMTIPANSENGINRYFSQKRIEKMANYRNKYLQYISDEKIISDVVMVIDFDIPVINVDAIVHSLNNKTKWDCLASNSYFFNSNLQRIYYDSYALVEIGEETKPQTEGSIVAKQRKFAFLRRGMPLFPVYSAFGGIALYKSQSIVGSKYSCIKNNDSRVEVRCEHFGLAFQMHQNGYNNFFIDPGLRFQYKKIIDKRNWNLLIKEISKI